MYYLGEKRENSCNFEEEGYDCEGAEQWSKPQVYLRDRTTLLRWVKNKLKLWNAV